MSNDKISFFYFYVTFMQLLFRRSFKLSIELFHRFSSLSFSSTDSSPALYPTRHHSPQGVRMAEVLLQAGLPADAVTTAGSATLLYQCAEKGWEPMLRLLLRYKAQVWSMLNMLCMYV